MAMEIAPWKKSAVILRDDGALYVVPIPCWVDPDPQTPKQTWFCEAPLDRSPRPMGNLFYEYARISPHPARYAVDLVADNRNQRLVVLDNTGDLVTDQPGQGFQVEKRASYTSIDVELDRSGQFAFIGDYFGGLKFWPGENSPIFTGLNYNWPAVADYETARGGDDVYVMDVQGGVFPFTRLDAPLIDLVKMKHYSPHDEPEAYTPYQTYPCPYFSDIELVPGEKAYFRMLWNFRIYYGVQKD